MKTTTEVGQLTREYDRGVDAIRMRIFMRVRAAILAGTAGAAFLAGAGASPAWAGQGHRHDDGRPDHDGTMRVSVATGGGQADSSSGSAAISGNGRYVTFTSNASNLVPGDTNGTADVFVRDLQSGQTERVSLGLGGAQGNGPSGNFFIRNESISADGRYVAFDSQASNLVPDDTNGKTDIFVRDRWTGKTIRGSLGAGGQQLTDETQYSSLSPDGRFLAFTTGATNAVPGDTNGTYDVFLRDLATGAVRRVSVGSGGVQGDAFSLDAAVSWNGSSVAFSSRASNLVPGDTNQETDVFVYDVATGKTTRISVGSDGSQGTGQSYFPSISDDGRRVAFQSIAPNLAAGDSNGVPDAFVRDRSTGRTILVSVSVSGGSGDGFTFDQKISGNGRSVAFASIASDLVPGDTNATADVFVRDLCRRVTRLVSTGPNGAIGNGYSSQPSISSDGRTAVFTSEATNLVPGDTNSRQDVFVRLLLKGHQH